MPTDGRWDLIRCLNSEVTRQQMYVVFNNLKFTLKHLKRSYILSRV